MALKKSEDRINFLAVPLPNDDIQRRLHSSLIAAEKPKIGILTPPQLQQLLNAASHYIQAFLMFGAYAGLRSSEISLIRWEDVDLESNEIYVPGKKNVCAERYVTLTAPLKDYCQKILKGDKPTESLVMAGLKNTSISQRRKKAMDETGIKIPRNALRHSYASHHLKHFGNGRKTAHEMGHSTEQMTLNTYRGAQIGLIESAGIECSGFFENCMSKSSEVGSDRV